VPLTASACLAGRAHEEVPYSCFVETETFKDQADGRLAPGPSAASARSRRSEPLYGRVKKVSWKFHYASPYRTDAPAHVHAPRGHQPHGADARRGAARLGSTRIEQTIYVETTGQKKILVGMIKDLGMRCRATRFLLCVLCKELYRSQAASDGVSILLDPGPRSCAGAATDSHPRGGQVAAGDDEVAGPESAPLPDRQEQEGLDRRERHHVSEAGAGLQRVIGARSHTTLTWGHGGVLSA
jgi:hypothetical protein